MRNESPFRRLVTQFAAMWPVLNVRDVRKKLGRDAFWRMSPDELATACAAVNVKRQPKDWTPGDSPNWEQLIRTIYLVRCNLVDDTPVPVLAPGTGKTKTGRLWTYVRDERPFAGPRPPAALFFYSPDRKGEHPQAHLKDFRGVIHADGYAGFNELFAGDRIVEAACWAHVRRKFFDVHVATGSPIAKEALDRIGQLYVVEKAINGSPPERRQPQRQLQSKPIAEALAAWAAQTVRRLSRKSELAQAFRYMQARWTALEPPASSVDAKKPRPCRGRRIYGSHLWLTIKKALVQDTAYSMLLRGPRQALHARIARALEERFPSSAQPQILAHHFTQAGLLDQAVAYWCRASRQSMEKSALVEAIAQLRRGLRLIADLPETSERNQRELELQVTLADALGASRGRTHPDVAEVLARALNLVLDTGAAGTTRHFQVLYGLWLGDYFGGRPQPALDRAKEFLSLAQAQTDSGARFGWTPAREFGACAGRRFPIRLFAYRTRKGVAYDRTTPDAGRLRDRGFRTHELVVGTLAPGLPGPGAAGCRSGARTRPAIRRHSHDRVGPCGYLSDGSVCAIGRRGRHPGQRCRRVCKRARTRDVFGPGSDLSRVGPGSAWAA